MRFMTVEGEFVLPLSFIADTAVEIANTLLETYGFLYYNRYSGSLSTSEDWT